MKVKSLSRVRLLATSWTAAYQAPPSMGFSRQEYWSGVPLSSPEEISVLSHSVVFLYFFALIAEEGFLISPCSITWSVNVRSCDSCMGRHVISV